MADWRSFNASNKEGTCLWCGNKLRRPKRMDGEYLYSQPGDYGDGFFCGLRCGYMFGTRLAVLGRRLQDQERK